MSRIGKIPVKIPAGVKVSFHDNTMFVEGPKGKLSQTYNPLVSFEQKEGEVIVSRADDEKQTKAYHGLYRNLLNNMITGVSTGFSRNLVVTGVGYRAEIQTQGKIQILVLSLGYSSDIYMQVPDGLGAVVDAQTNKITITGIDKQKVGEFASEIRKLRLPEPYKGKGVHYEEEQIRRKVGKSGVK
jgi:large subunit ribosomal protein L6